MNAKEILQSLNELDETERVEAKRSTEVGKSVMETVCAFANEPGLGGGWIALGIVRVEGASPPAYRVEGVGDPDKVSSDFVSQCSTMLNRPVRVDVATERIDGKVVLVAFVPEAQAHEKPLFFAATGLPKGAFRRIGSTDQRCDEDDLAMFFQGRKHESFDASIVDDATRDDLAGEAIAEYRRLRAETHPSAEELGWTDDDLLRSLTCVAVDSKGVLRPTVAGIVLFGTPIALRRIFSMTRVDYIRVPGRDWIPDPERRFDSVEVRDSLFRAFRRVQAAIFDDLPKSFFLPEGEAHRQDVPALPLRVVREGLVNAFMHRSYRNDQPLQVIRYANRLEIRNPGFSLKSPEHLGEPGSEARNPKIAAVLYETRLAESKGSGIRVMRESMRIAGLAPPVFESDRSRNLFVARYFFHHFLGDDDIAWLAQFKEHRLSEDEAKALIVVREAGTINNAAFRDLSGLDTLTASAALGRLRDAGVLMQHGRGSATFYGLSKQPKGESPALRGESPALRGESPALRGESPALRGESPALRGEPSPTGQRSQLLEELGLDLSRRLSAVGKRRPPGEMRALVAEICTLRSWTAEELAILLGRNAETIRNRYLRPLMREGRISMTLPEQPNDPNQAYRAVAGKNI